jgi:hypothetical protein
MKKNIKYALMIVIAGTLLTVTSCKKTFYTNANNDVNAPAVVPPGTILSTVEVNLAYTQGGTFSWFESMFTQQTIGISRQSAAYYQYIFTTQDFENIWGSIYTSVMNNDYNLMQLADKNGFNKYSGISRILMAYSLELTVDAWGKVPYSQAFLGASNVQPGYDNDQTLYQTTIPALLTTGIADLNNSNPGTITPSSDDFLYGGNAAEWIKFANAISARIALHQTKLSASNAAAVLTALGSSFTSNADNAVLFFGSTQNNSNPWYQFNQQRGDIGFTNSTLADTLIATSDPRLNIFIDTAMVNGVPTDINEVGAGPYYMNVNSPVEFITNDEVWFMKAEATILSSGVNQTAVNDLDSAISNNMEKLGVPSSAITTYLVKHTLSISLSSTAALSYVANEEWKALYTNPEEWTIYRLFSGPTLTIPTGATLTQIPLRFNYPFSEYSYNATNLAAAYPGQSVTLLSPKIFWEQ